MEGRDEMRSHFVPASILPFARAMMHQVLMNGIESSNDSVIRLAVTVVIMGNTIAVIMLSGIGIAGRSAFVLFARQ